MNKDVQNIDIIKAENNALIFEDISILEFEEILNKFQDVFFVLKYNDKKEQVGVVMSPSAEKIIGYSIEEMRKMNFSDFYVNTDDRTLFFEDLKKEGELKNYPLVFKRKDGKRIHVEIDCHLILENLEQGVAFSLRGVLRDVTKQYKENLRSEIAFLIAQKTQNRLFSLNSFGEFIYNTLKGIFNITNFYIVQKNHENTRITFPFLWINFFFI